MRTWVELGKFSSFHADSRHYAPARSTNHAECTFFNLLCLVVPLSSSLLSSPRQLRRDAPLSALRRFSFVYRACISCTCVTIRGPARLVFSTVKLYLSSDLLSIRFARPLIRCREPRRLPHLVCWLLTHELLINSRALPPSSFSGSFLCVLLALLFSFVFSFVQI